MSLPAGTPGTRAGELLGAPSSGRLFVLYGRLLGPLLGGYLLFDRAFAYLHLPGSPLFVGEMVLGVGAVAAVVATRYLQAPIRDEPILALLGAFVLWGLVRMLSGLGTYHLDAVRDAALWYYCVFAFLVVAALARSPELLDHLVAQLTRLTPWLLLWLPLGLILAPLSKSAPTVPFSTVSVLSHKSGSAAIAAMLVLGCLWLLPDTRTARSRAGWSLMALLVIALAATQNRGGLLGVVAGATVGLAFLHNRAALAARAILIVVVGLGMASLLSLKIPMAGVQGREFSASQLVANVVSLGGKESPGNLGGTVQGRQELWSRILDKQIADGRLVHGSGFGQNLATEVGVYDEGKESLRSPHNSHLHIVARMGLVGISLWIALWIGWYWRLVAGCRRLARQGMVFRRQVAVLSLMVATAVLVSCFFDPQLEGPQVAALLWTAFGIGVAVTTRRPWYADGSPSTSDRP
ncbi:O-antigen ligase-like membrane protein [Kribbella orskensis]|uniref:O-antigen ligase-like membrane protein n=1 Tax=Kribbella orskensis TaxID=2512216 RepID=A0ABY2BRZ5_9ACTN|nr:MULTISPECIES: O-antigen ligase family protein [Kribbella]TCN43194.1 O-antigen ligase-like membrane protein [Kribbella sp. VKM Ac-2500]TCO29450.1 O-antigen ligase-like membrane protein [Kribbella orskensis]